MMIGLARRGYSSTGGAEAFLSRFSEALKVPGHQSRLYTTSDWPAEAWTAGERIVLPGRTPREFADALTARNPRSECDLFFSLERVWNCDGYRAGDGVHAAWLQRRTVIEPPWRSKLHRFNPKHRQLLALEFALFAGGGAKKIIVNSQMIAFEIREHYGVAPDRIRLVYNGLPAAALDLPSRPSRDPNGELRVLFAGSGWGRKGLAFAIGAIERLPESLRPVLLVAGRGDQSRFPASSRVRYLGPVANMAEQYAAADIFLLPTIYDPFSNACLEALAAGLPVVTTRANGFAEILPVEIAGTAVKDPTDVPALTAALEHWADPARRRAATDAAREIASAFTIEKTVAETIDALTQPAG
jgi:UDP-glucose:(heptosyl)LPS alpha-1,3-glucosyltransferase